MLTCSPRPAVLGDLRATIPEQLLGRRLSPPTENTAGVHGGRAGLWPHPRDPSDGHLFILFPQTSRGNEPRVI